MNLLFKTGVIASLLAASATQAGTLIIGGDITPTFALGPAGFSGVEGNRQFYSNLRGGASRIVLSTRSFSSPNSPSLANDNLRRFYTATPGVSVLDSSSEITTATLATADFLIVQFPNFTFTTGEIAAIGGFVRAGGRLFVSGEASTIDTFFPAGPIPQGTLANISVNGLLTGIGATIRIANDSIGCCNNLLTGHQIAINSLTASVMSFSYGAATSVTGGTALLSAPVNFQAQAATRVIFATETLSAVPEPWTWTLLITGFGLTGVALRRVRQGQAL